MKEKIFQAILDGLIACANRVRIQDNDDGQTVVHIEFLLSGHHEFIVTERDGELIVSDGGWTRTYMGEWLDQALQEFPDLIDGEIRFVDGRIECPLKNIVDLAIAIDRLYICWDISTAK